MSTCQYKYPVRVHQKSDAVQAMFHDQYTRRRTADSFPHDERDSGSAPDGWSWSLFVGLILIQMTARCLWVSFGMITFFILRDNPHPWDLMWTPVVYTATWTLAAPWVKLVCRNVSRSREYMLISVLGVFLSCLGVLVAVHYPLTVRHLIPLLGVLGGLGSAFSLVSCECLALRHFPNRSGAIRTFSQTMTALSVFCMPILSYCLMNNFGEHGGLLLHAGVLLQGVIGAVLLKGADWEKEKPFEQRDRSYTFVEADGEGDPWTNTSKDMEEIEGSTGFERSWKNPGVETDEPEIVFRPRREFPVDLERQEQLLSGETRPKNRYSLRQKFFQAKRRKRRKVIPGVEILPRIVEVNEAPGGEALEEDASELRRSLEELNRVSLDIIAREGVNQVKKPPRTFEHYRKSVEVWPDVSTVELPYGEEEADEQEQEEKEEDDIREEEVEDTIAADTVVDISAPGQPNGVVVQLAPKSVSNRRSVYTRLISAQDGSLFRGSTATFRGRLCRVLSHVKHYPWDRCCFLEPLLIPAAFLLFSIQFSVVGFMALTPLFVHRFVEDVSGEDTAFAVCLMGFTWLSFAIASPCFTAVHFTNHHLICIGALFIASISSYLLSESEEQDELSLYACLYGVSQGIAQMTSHSVLKLSLGRELEKFQVALSLLVPLMFIITQFTCGRGEWFLNLRNSYKLFSLLLAVSTVVWLVQWCITTVRKGQSGIRLSRRRRIS